jgi:natural product biosynthesis luciferase-like monooxygenase protein
MRFSLMFFSAAGDETGSSKYDMLLQAAQLADDSPIEAVWMPERHFAPFGGLYPNPSVLGAAVAVQTHRIRIRAGSVILPLQDPLRVAEEWSVVDNLSGGRVDLSFGSGWNADDFVLAPERYESRREDLAAGIDEVRRLWRGEKITRRNGAGRTVEIGVLPRPVQPELPVWLTAQSESSFARAGIAGDPVLTNLNFNSPAVLARNVATYREHAATAVDPGRRRVALMVHAYAGSSAAEARTATTGPLRTYLRSNLDLRERSATARGGDGPAVDAEQVEAIVARGVDRIQGWAGLIGDTDALADKVAYFREQGVDELACLIDFGVDPDATARSVSRLCTLAERYETAALPS